MNYQSQSQPSLIESFNRLKSAYNRYWQLSWPPALAITLLTLFVAFKIPNYYTSSFIVRIQAQQIDAGVLGRSEKKEDTATLSALIEELKARQKLLSIIQEFDLYPNLKGLRGQEKALEKFQKAYIISPIQGALSKQNENSSSLIFQVSYSHSNRDKVFKVTDKLQNLYISESLINVRSETRATEEFLSAQLKAAQKKLETIEKKREEYLRNNAGKLPENREKAIFERKILMDKVFLNNQTIEANQGRIRYLRDELSMTVRDPSTAGNTQISSGVELDPSASLSQLQQTLSLLKGRYSDKHPDVIALQNRIAQLKGKIKRGEIKGSGGASSPGINLGNTRESRLIRREISEAEVQNAKLQAEIKTLQAEIDDLTKSINTLPAQENELSNIERDYETQKDLYEKLMVDHAQAAMKVDLIQSQRGPRFTIIDPPTKPEIPAGPPRLIIAGAAFALGILILTLIPIGFYYLNSSFKFKKEAENELPVPVLGVIPPLKTPAVISQKRKSMATSFGTSLITLVAGIIAIFIAL